MLPHFFVSSFVRSVISLISLSLVISLFSLISLSLVISLISLISPSLISHLHWHACALASLCVCGPVAWCLCLIGFLHMQIQRVRGFQ